MECKVCSGEHCWHCQTCLEHTSSLHGRQCDSCYAKTLDGHFNCKECGKAYHSSLTGAKLREGLCFKCDFWTEKVEWSNKEEQEMPIRVKGVHYRPGFILGRGGFGGTKFVIRLADGSIFSTRNLWSQGPIPARFRDRLPDNASFADVEDVPVPFREL